MDRGTQLDRLRREAFDLVVIGGGITGTAAARDAALRGLRTALLEARDFAQGTSSRSSRLVHGGLRYLEQLAFDLVFEASQERRRLLRIAPHLVRPLEFLFPLYREGGVGKLKLDAGMWLYDALSLFRNIERHRMLDEDEVLAREPELRAEGLLGGARYFDAQVDDARLVVTTALAAAEAGAAVANGVEAVRIVTGDWPGHGVVARDLERDEELRIDALAILNATGPWTDETRRRAGLPHSDMVRPSRGTHIHLPRERLPHRRALIFESPLDARIMFVLPWNDLTLVGTTDEFDAGDPAEVAPTAADVRYLLESANGLFPRAGVGPSDVVGAWAGLRPLVALEEGEVRAGEVSRDFVVREEPPGLFTVAGGKLTSHRAMAEEAVDEVAAFLEKAGVRAARESDTARIPLPGGEFEDRGELREAVRARAAALGVPRAAADRLARAYGTRAEGVLGLVEARPELGRLLVPGRPYVGAEAVHAARSEMARHVGDVAYRRTHLARETRGPELREGLRRVAVLMGEELGWDEDRRAAEVEEVLRVRARDDGWRTVAEGEAPGEEAPSRGGGHREGAGR